MRLFYKILRMLLAMILALLFLLPAVLFVILSFPSVQHDICRKAEVELTKLIDMNVEIGDVSIAPFNRLTLHKVVVADSAGDTVMSARRIGAGINLFDLVAKRRMVFSYAEIVGLDARISRDSIGAPLNIQPIIDALSPKDKNKPPTKYDFRINTVVIRKSSISYDVLSMPEKDMVFDPNHIQISDLRADMRIPRISNDEYDVNLRRLAFSDRSGFMLKSLSGDFHITPVGAEISGFAIDLDDSHIAFNDISVPYASYASIRESLPSIPVDFSIAPDSYVEVEDLTPFVPAFAGLDARVKLNLDLSGRVDSLVVDNLDLSTDDGNIWLRGEGEVRNLLSGIDAVEADVPRISIGAYGTDIADILQFLSPAIDGNVTNMCVNLGHVNLLGSLSGTRESGHMTAQLLTDPGVIEAEADYRRKQSSYKIYGNVQMPDFDGVALTKNATGMLAALGGVSAKVTCDLNVGAGVADGKVAVEVGKVVFKEHAYTNLMASLDIEGTKGHLDLDLDNPGASIMLVADADLGKNGKSLNMQIDADDISLYQLNVINRYPDHRLSIHGGVELEGSNIDDICGSIDFQNIKFVDDDDRGLNLGSLSVEASYSPDSIRTMVLLSDFIEGRIDGNYSFMGVVPAVRDLMSHIFPSLIEMRDSVAIHSNPHVAVNDFTYNFVIKDTEPLGNLIKLPVNVIYPMTISGEVDYPAHAFSFDLDAPYLQQKDKLIENTSLRINVDAGEDAGKQADMYFTMLYPTKKGAMTLMADAFAVNDHVDFDFSWNVARDRTFKGDVRLSASFGRDDENRQTTRVNVNPSELVFNDTVWNVNSASIDISDNRAKVNGFRVGRQNQYISINGQVSSTPDDSLTLVLKDVNLDYIFETLDIGTAMFGGIATGTFYASSLFSPAPCLYTPSLDVQNLSYNKSLMGNASIKSEWLPDEKAVTINALIDQPNGCKSKILGAIFPMADSLDFHFDADKIEIGFMKPFMEAFTSDVSGFASGKARLWGTFKLIDMVGDIYAQDVKLKLDFTNTYYTATDSVRLTPGRIDLDNITLRDVNGNTALLNGWITHKCFKQPRFNFAITNARNMLVYDVRENPESIWYGTIYGNGSAGIVGVPGEVDINVNMSTAARSTFTFVLSDAEQAYDYNFITFRDRDQALKDSLRADNATPQIVRELKKRIARSEEGGGSSVYKMNIAVDVTPSALVTLVMDPVGGDRIKAYGSGNLRMSYDSANEDLKMFGTYTLTRGNYNFTLQDIIIKDFTIRDGSSISFHGDPYSAQLDIKAVYSVNANLSDLDESFLDDKELNRTNVPVNALLNVNGDMRQPDINFDLEFPTLTQDTYRKVRSIVSTEDMMNRQIIYLLALNRFYTPEYMNTTKGNELVSVASSTISSHLGSILGQLSDNWSIAPNFRSDRGDFSDVEVDLALSSHLLNNRLLFNGNFGYRDKSLNNNSFIGDFDIEYLLNRSGSIRLKAYNRYNDQNYYVKNSLTTQGVGVVFKRDFDNVFSFLRPLRRKFRKKEAEKPKPVEADTTVTVDTVDK